MNLETVLKAGDFSFYQKMVSVFQSGFGVKFFCFLSAIWITIVGVLIYMFIIDQIFRVEETKYEKTIPGVFIVLFLIVGFPSGILLCYNVSAKYDSKPVYLWESEYVIPYLNTLPEKTYVIEDVQKDNEETKSFIKNIDDERTTIPYTIVYKDEKGFARTLRSEAILQFDLKKGEQPYMTVKELPVDLGHGIEKGLINPVIHISKKEDLNQF
jgi:hypothetical protein